MTNKKLFCITSSTLTASFTCLMMFLILSCSNAQTAHRSDARSDSGTSRTRLRERIDEILSDSVLLPGFVGVKIISVDDESVLYKLNSRKLFHPASNMKLLTTATALALLDENFLFKTVVTSDARFEEGVLAGNLYVKGFGDPLLMDDDLDSLAHLISDHGIKTVTGDLVGDISYFDDLPWGKGWMWDDEPDPSVPFISPLTVNSNSIKIIITPGRTIGDTLHYELIPPMKSFLVINKGITSKDTIISPLKVDRVHDDNIITIEGRLSPGDAEEERKFSVRHPEQFFLDLLRLKLIEYGVQVNGITRIDTLRGTLDVGEFCHSIDTVLCRINKESDNLAAENLLKTIAAERLGVPGSAVHGLSILKEHLNGIGVDTMALVVADGSGASFYNLISPECIVEILNHEYKEKKSFDRFLSSLSIAGVDGTLKNRMKGTNGYSNVRAKTGTISGTSSLSGYVTTKEGELLAFSILMNHFPGEATVFRQIQDAIMEVLAEYQVQKE